MRVSSRSNTSWQVLASFLLVSWLVSLLVLWSSVSFAEEVLVWQATPKAPRVLLPLLAGETPAQAVEKYFESMKANAEMARFFSSVDRPDTKTSSFSKISPIALSKRTRIVVQANDPYDIHPDGRRIGRLLEVINEQKGEAFVLAPAAALRLTKEEQVRFQDALYDQFDMRMNIGGDDVHPAEYGQRITWARKEELNRTRDKYEIQLIRHWQMRNDRALARGTDGKPEFGICRGHQIMAVASGHTMIQDNVRDGASRDGTHLDRLGDPAVRSIQHWHHVYISDSLLAELLGKRGDVKVNDWHHESVKANPLARTRVVALAPDGIVEALESPDRLTLSVQFHPEFNVEQSGNAEFTTMGHRLLGGLFAHARAYRVHRECSTLFKVAR